MDAMALAELLCARLCHDMAGPVGAAAAGAELIADMAGEVDLETVGLVAASAAAGAARLKFFRATLGPAVSSSMGGAAVHDLVAGYLGSQSSALSGLGLDWHVGQAPLAGPWVRLLLNLVLLSRDCLPRGGTITVRYDPIHLQVTARGDSALLPPEEHSVLIVGDDPVSPRGAQAWLTRSLAQAVGSGLVVETISTEIGFSVACAK